MVITRIMDYEGEEEHRIAEGDDDDDDVVDENSGTAALYLQTIPVPVRLHRALLPILPPPYRTSRCAKERFNILLLFSGI